MRLICFKIKTIKVGYYISLVNVRNYHKFSDLKQKIYFLTVLEVRSPEWVPLGQNQGVDRAAFFLQAPGENLFLSCLFNLLETAHVLWLVALPSIFKASNKASLNLSNSSTFKEHL